MVHSSRTVRSASSGRFVQNATVTSPQKSPTPLPKLNNTNARPAATNSPATTTSSFKIGKTNSLYGWKNELPLESTAVAARPPVTRISLDPGGALRQTTNGVVTDVELCSNDVAAIADASATTFDRAITKDSTPAPGDKDKRVLRSQGGSSRSKSSLARFFPDFEEVVFGATSEPELLTADSILFVFEDKSESLGKQSQAASTNKKDIQSIFAVEKVYGASSSQAGLSTNGASENILVMDFTPFAGQAQIYEQDPLAASIYVQAHRRGERKEKQLRNIEKEHALHEKSDLERLLEELKGPDWLKIMGISGVTESEKKKYEPYRNQYIQRVKALLEKFGLWKEQERELKLRREEALLAREEADEEDGDEPEAQNEESVAETHSHSSELVDASARQLQLEAKSVYTTSPRAKPRSSKTYLPIPEPETEKPFFSFYSKPHLRAAAVGSHRRGRTVTAFGQPVPDVFQEEFALPENFLSEETIIANARKRRRMKRESNVNSSGSKP